MRYLAGMKRRLAAALVLLCLVSVCALILFRREASRDPTPVATSRDGAAPTVAPTLAPEARAIHPGERMPVQARGSDTETGLRVEVVEAREASAECVPVADAEVMFCVSARFAPPQLARALDALTDFEARAQRFGGSVRTDATGVAILPPLAHGRHDLVAARRGTSYGEVGIAEDDDRVRIELQRDRTLRVYVVGPSDEPIAGVSVRMLIVWPDAEQDATVELGISDAGGWVVGAHVQLRLAERQRMHRDAPRALRVVPRIVGLRHEGVALDPARLPDDPVRLVLPATGSARVEVAYRGAPLSTLWSAQVVEVSRDATERGDMPLFPPRYAEFVEMKPIALGTSLRAEVRAYKTTLPPQERPGPTRPGEQVMFRFRLGDDHPVARVRVIDASMVEPQPAQARQDLVSLTLAVDGQLERYHSLALDADGVVCAVLDQRHVGKELQGLICERRLYGKGTGRMACVQTKRVVTVGINDLGTVELSEGPLVVAGTVVDQNGKASAAGGLQVRAAGAPPGTPAYQLTEDRQPDGGFTLRGFVDADDLILRDGSGRAAAIPFARGATGIRLVVPRLGHLVGLVRHDLSHEHARMLRLFAIPEDSPAAVRRSSSSGAVTNDQVRLAMGHLDAGVYTVDLRLGDDPAPLATVARVEVGAGAVRDPRLRAFDVRGRVRLAQITLLDAGGQPVREVGEFHTRVAAGYPLWPIETRHGVLRVPIGASKVSGTLRVPGYRDCELVDLDGDRTVTLAAPLVTRVRLTPPLALPAGVTLHALARPKGEATNPLLTMFAGSRGPLVTAGVRAVTLPAAQAFELRLANPGDYDLTFIVATAGETASVVLPATPASVSVPATDGTEVVFVTDEATLRRVLGELPR